MPQASCATLRQMPASSASAQAINTLACVALSSDEIFSAVSNGLMGCTMAAASPPHSAKWYSAQPGSMMATVSWLPRPRPCSAFAVWLILPSSCA
ncbi:hypothetical protein D3C78_1657990 [compost metagenome]